MNEGHSPLQANARGSHNSGSIDDDQQLSLTKKDTASKRRTKEYSRPWREPVKIQSAKAEPAVTGAACQTSDKDFSNSPHGHGLSTNDLEPLSAFHGIARGAEFQSSALPKPPDGNVDFQKAAANADDKQASNVPRMMIQLTPLHDDQNAHETGGRSTPNESARNTSVMKTKFQQVDYDRLESNADDDRNSKSITDKDGTMHSLAKDKNGGYLRSIDRQKEIDVDPALPNTETGVVGDAAAILKRNSAVIDTANAKYSMSSHVDTLKERSADVYPDANAKAPSVNKTKQFSTFNIDLFAQHIVSESMKMMNEKKSSVAFKEPAMADARVEHCGHCKHFNVMSVDGQGDGKKRECTDGACCRTDCPYEAAKAQEAPAAVSHIDFTRSFDHTVKLQETYRRYKRLVDQLKDEYLKFRLNSID